MNEELLKHLLNLKISLVRKVLRKLPESVQKPAKELENQVMRMLYDISKEYTEKAPIAENKKQAGGLKTIKVD
ncbi:hypothetical protein E4K67_29245 [Desulfosporosinus fructosivorans]|uniref:Uncharacterized protein n=1 Tax=Desulfosporosinus fructosivorans TaxID=2018669 RepID=A0A4Z0QW17_9FIRM|nr:hypothetical protein [Desulfosporosinus fructosivorans]TGE34714.1 hypothetical protein E4K67_29245 [Desulfosporosinus fructosivorans]